MNIKKYNLVPIFEFLGKINLVGAASRARTKLNKEIGNAINELQSDEVALAEELGGRVNDEGRVVFVSEEDLNETEAAEYSKKKHAEFTNAQSDLRQEEAIFNEATKDQFNRLKNALYDYDEKLSGQDATVYDILLDALEA
ncbi:hypothetical protein [Leuconostoc mesenteroides]|uniref:hypothetical protein n=2 Tax=Leuconostoc mesenteroides TaxID=1245 RepID=UPI000FFCC65A|nr:hypothetical protein [Leuconostoc mesenteroides]MBZ1521049.1 hypothetical protein [Leuconostoc mesenteroides]MBZ1523281.1 hypothetical protein [Leuconostoc mesenteroides]QAR69654.1 hypothetical protein EQI52_07495 [Leuconostoc mesenteroides]WJM73615.1 hypothetical protein QTN54_02340 [Leuconostoc mesenteroides]